MTKRKQRWNRIWKEVQRLVLLALGIVASSIGFALFQVPYDLAAGGVSGIAIIVNHFTGFSPSIFYLLANLPLFLVGYFALGGWRFLYRTILAVIGFSFLTEWLATVAPAYLGMWPITDNLLLSAIYAGLVGGIGGGLIFASGGTLGGTAILGRMIQVRTGVPISQVYLLMDGAIVVAAAFIFGWEIALYAYLTLLLSGLATDYVLEGPSRTRSATIITTNPEPLIAAIIAELGRGVSYWDGHGGYTGERRTVIICTFYRPQLNQLRKVIHDIDPKAFVTIGIAQQAIGEGFIDLRTSIG